VVLREHPAVAHGRDAVMGKRVDQSADQLGLVGQVKTVNEDTHKISFTQCLRRSHRKQRPRSPDACSGVCVDE